jgi:hypothetical protein
MREVKIDSSKASLVNVSGKLFSIPSPIQTALLINQSNATYDRTQLNVPKNSTIYASRLKRALNLGVYGTDMAYASISDDGQSALGHFKAVENLAENLGIKAAIDPNLVKRLGANAGNADSLMILSSDFYREADNYLKQNERTDVAALILTGGWIEATFLTAQAAKSDNEMARTRLAEQGQAAETIYEVLSSQDDEELKNSDLIQKIDSIRNSYASIKREYVYETPETNPEAKKTIFKSNSTYSMNDSLFNSLSAQLERLRKEIILP